MIEMRGGVDSDVRGHHNNQSLDWKNNPHFKINENS
jgi:hypothetical protein